VANRLSKSQAPELAGRSRTSLVSVLVLVQVPVRKLTLVQGPARMLVLAQLLAPVMGTEQALPRQVPPWLGPLVPAPSSERKCLSEMALWRLPLSSGVRDSPSVQHTALQERLLLRQA
jgi:hypothetical protein